MFRAAAEPKPKLSGRIFLVYAEVPSPLSILYAGIVMLEGDRRNFQQGIRDDFPRNIASGGSEQRQTEAPLENAA